MSYSELSSEESDLSSDDESRKNEGRKRDEVDDSDVDSIDLEYRNARMFLDIFEIEDFVRYVLRSTFQCFYKYGWWIDWTSTFCACREKTPDDRLTPVAEGGWNWMDSDDEVESEPDNTEQSDNLDHLTLAERIALKRKAEEKSESCKQSYSNRSLD